MDSIWSKTCKRKKRPALSGEIRADVAVIGGGITGILTAWQLEQAGIRTVILEADQIGGGQTKNTTAKITSQHGMFCNCSAIDFWRKKAKKRRKIMYRLIRMQWKSTRELSGKKELIVT